MQRWRSQYEFHGKLLLSGKAFSHMLFSPSTIFQAFTGSPEGLNSNLIFMPNSPCLSLNFSDWPESNSPLHTADGSLLSLVRSPKSQFRFHLRAPSTPQHQLTCLIHSWLPASNLWLFWSTLWCCVLLLLFVCVSHPSSLTHLYPPFKIQFKYRHLPEALAVNSLIQRPRLFHTLLCFLFNTIYKIYCC